MTVVGILVFLLTALLASCGLVNGVDELAELAPDDPITEYGLTEIAAVADYAGDMHIRLPEGWVTSRTGTLYFSPDADAFELGYITPEKITDNIQVLGNLSFIYRDDFDQYQGVSLNPDIELMPFVEAFFPDVSDFQAFASNGKQAAIRTFTLPDAEFARSTVVQVIIEDSDGFALLTFTTVEERPFELQELARAIAGTFSFKFR